MPNPLVELRNIRKSYGGNLVIDNVSLSIEDGEFITLLGPSGCGKTTLLRMLAGFEIPDQGTIHIGGQDVTTVPPNRRAVNTVFQSYALFPHMSVFENVAFGLKVKKVGRDEIKARVMDALRMVKLDDMAGRKPQALSGGQQQRVAIARAVVNKPRVLLLDEPLSALDFKLRKAMQLELKELRRALGITFVYVTHDQEEAFSMSDRVAVVNKGRIEQLGAPKDIYEQPANLFTARFVGEINILDATVIKQSGRNLDAMIGAVPTELISDRNFAPGEKIKVLTRPEDIRLERWAERSEENALHGRVVESIYKGTTIDLIVRMDTGQRLLATEFFNEDAMEDMHQLGDEVAVFWVDGWEVVLPDEADS